MKISIIVPVYNVELYIRECFDSIAAQTYNGGLECIFVDDCGQDKSVEILEGLMATYQGNIDFRLVHHEHNKGLSGARNTGIRNATGEYLYFLDSDDTITPDCIEKMVELAEKYPRVEVVQGSVMNPTPWLTLAGKNVPEYSNNPKWIKNQMLQNCCLPVTAWNKLIKRNFVAQNKLYFSEGMIHEDELWTFFISKYIKTIAFCFIPTYFYRDNPNGIMKGGQNNDDSYKPVVEAMTLGVSHPYPTYDILRIADIIKEHNSSLSLDEFINNLKFNNSLITLFLYSRKKVLVSSKFSVFGVLWRVVYKVLFMSINLFYPL